MRQPENVDVPTGNPAKNLIDSAVLVIPQHAPGQPDDDRHHHHRQHENRHGKALAGEIADKEQREPQSEQEFEPDRRHDDDAGIL
jgi:hypothetical protein